MIWGMGSSTGRALLVALISALALAFSAADAIEASRLDDPALAPTSPELPPIPSHLPGFIPTPELDSEPRSLGVVGAFRWYGRSDVITGATSARLVTGVTISERTDMARTVFHETVRVLAARGYELERLPGLVSETALVGRRPIAQANENGEALVVYFQSGLVGGVVEWEEYADHPSIETALNLARLIESGNTEMRAVDGDSVHGSPRLPR